MCSPYTIQYIPAAGPFIPIADLVIGFPALSYQVFFEENTADAIIELDNNITRTIRATLRTVDSPPPATFLKSTSSFLSGWNDVATVRDGYAIVCQITQGLADTACSVFHCRGGKLYRRTIYYSRFQK
jgi:hypothetical protein